MEINARFDEVARHHYYESAWVPSPMAGVERQMLDRIGDEAARATSLVRYAPDSEFSRHVHTGGEEFLVLDGVFSDEHGDFPAGSYVRNPPTSSHAPHSGPGCLIFVKLWQFDLDDREHVVRNIDAVDLAPLQGRAGVTGARLYEDEHESVWVERLAADAPLEFCTDGGTELLVLDGTLQSELPLGPRDWMRVPPASGQRATAGPDGARVWVKRGHLVDAKERFEAAFARAG